MPSIQCKRKMDKFAYNIIHVHLESSLQRQTKTILLNALISLSHFTINDML